MIGSPLELPMNVVRLNKNVRSVVALGESGPVTVYEQKTRKKLTRANKQAEARTRRFVKASVTALNAYLAAHQKSNAKKKDGWMRDYSWNATKAARKGIKRWRLFG